jgi:hypothetical protein
MQPPYPELLPPQKVRERRSQKLMEKHARTDELLRMTRKELCELATHIVARLPAYDGSPSRKAALLNPRNIRSLAVR